MCFLSLPVCVFCPYLPAVCVFWTNCCSAANWLKPPNVEQRRIRHTPRYLTRAYWLNNSRKLLFLCAYASLNLTLFMMAILQNAAGGICFMIAKGCGQCLNLNCTFVMVSALHTVVMVSQSHT